MKVLKESDYLDAIVEHLVRVANHSTCKRSKCGSIIVAKGFTDIVIGEGYNSMPGNCIGECSKDNLPENFKSDKTCCVHAEQRAIMYALKREFRDKIVGSTLYFIRLDENNQPKHSGAPYCSICSKMALDVGIDKFVLWHKEGWTAYDTKEYNDLTFKYNGDVIK